MDILVAAELTTHTGYEIQLTEWVDGRRCRWLQQWSTVGGAKVEMFLIFGWKFSALAYRAALLIGSSPRD